MKISERQYHAKKIAVFLNKNTILRTSDIEDKLNIPATTLTHLKAGRRTSLKPKHLQKLSKFLSDYGFNTSLQSHTTVV